MKWKACLNGECKCMTVWDLESENQVAEIVCGPWGDRYPTIELEGTSLDRRAVAVNRLIEYGSVPPDEAKRNLMRIAAAPEMQAALEQIVEILWGPYPTATALLDIRRLATEALRVAAEGHPEYAAKIHEISAKLHPPSVVK